VKNILIPDPDDSYIHLKRATKRLRLRLSSSFTQWLFHHHHSSPCCPLTRHPAAVSNDETTKPFHTIFTRNKRCPICGRRLIYDAGWSRDASRKTPACAESRPGETEGRLHQPTWH